MWQKISEISLKMYLSLVDSIRSFKEDERGLSGVVVAILLILVAVLAVILIWGFLSGWLKDMWENITGQADTVKLP